MGLPPELADVLTGDPAVADFFDSAVAAHPNPRAIANWTANDVLRELKGRSVGELPFTGAELADLVRRVDAGGITTAAAKTVFGEMMAGGGAPDAIIRRLGLDQAVGGADLSAAVDAVLASMPDKVESYRGGQDQPARPVHRAGDEGHGREGRPEGRAGRDPQKARAGRGGMNQGMSCEEIEDKGRERCFCTSCSARPGGNSRSSTRKGSISRNTPRAA